MFFFSLTILQTSFPPNKTSLYQWLTLRFCLDSNSHVKKWGFYCGDTDNFLTVWGSWKLEQWSFHPTCSGSYKRTTQGHPRIIIHHGLILKPSPVVVFFMSFMSRVGWWLFFQPSTNGRVQPKSSLSFATFLMIRSWMGNGMIIYMVRRVRVVTACPKSPATILSCLLACLPACLLACLLAWLIDWSIDRLIDWRVVHNKLSTLLKRGLRGPKIFP